MDKTVECDSLGRFSVDGVPAKATISVWCPGFYTKEEPVANREQVQIVMIPEDMKGYSEKVTLPFRGMVVQKNKSTNLSSVSKNGLNLNLTDVEEGVRNIPGLQLISKSGQSQEGSFFSIRGVNTMIANSTPLIVVNGVPYMPDMNESGIIGGYSKDIFNILNVQDIENITVLKGADAAMYGSLGSNGVIMIETDKAADLDTKVEFIGQYGLSWNTSTLPVLGVDDYKSLMGNVALTKYEDMSDALSAFPYLKDDPEFYYKYLYNNNTDWQDLIYQDGFSQEYNISVSGGSRNGSWHSFSGNYLKQQGIIKESGFTRYSIRANMGRKIKSWLDMGVNISFSHTDTDFSRTNSNDYGVIRSALVFPTTYDPSDDETLNSDELSWLASNPYAYINSAKDNLKSNNVFTSSYLEIKLFPFLKFRQNLGINYTNRERGTYYGRRTSEGSEANNINGKAGQSTNWSMGITAESLFTFDKTFKKIHSVNAVGGFTVEKRDYGSKSMSATGFPSDLTQEYDMSLGTLPGKLKSDRTDSSLASFLGRINYTLMDKYIFTASYRVDGSSKFTENNKWANFLSGAVAWRLSEEKFIKNLNIFSNLKLRLSYGETGNQGIGSYRTLPMLNPANYPFSGGAISSGFAEVEWRGPVAEDLHWETTA